MIRWVLIFLFMATAAQAETVTIRSGEHENFSRLVLSIGSVSQWEISPTEGGYLLNLTGQIEGFDTRSVFERIPRDRLIDVTQEDQSSLFLQVECDCHLDTFLWRSGRLVLDIIDGPAPIDLSGDVPSENSTRAVENPLETQLPSLLRLQASQSQPAPLPLKFQDVRQSPEISATETALIEGLARAASQGFLEPAIQTNPPPNVGEVTNSILESDESQESLENLDQPGIGISSAIDREFALLGDVLESVVGQQCLDSELFNISSWGDGSDFHDQAAFLAEDLAGEFGEEPREAQDKLAKLYLHFGFGAEAKGILAADLAQSQSRRVLNELAGIIDDYPGSYDLIEAQAGCPTPAALWAFYVAPVALTQEDRNVVLQYFYTLPQPLRGQFAPRLAQKFISINDTETALNLLEATVNRDVESIHDVKATQALIASESDDPERAIEVLANEADDNVRMTPTSLIRLIDLAIGQGQLPQESDLVLAAVMRQEYRDTPVAFELAVAEAKALIALGRYHDALILMDGRNDEVATGIINQTYTRLVQNASTATFLEFAFADIPISVNEKTENLISLRLIELGFPERARDLIEGSAAREDVELERRLLRSRTAIASGNYLSALEELDGLTDARARVLRATAYGRLGEYRAALDETDATPSEGNEEILQFRAGAWERLTTDGDETLSSFDAATLSPNIEEPLLTLADRRAVLAQSQESRRAVEGLLLRFDAEISPE